MYLLRHQFVTVVRVWPARVNHISAVSPSPLGPPSWSTRSAASVPSVADVVGPAIQAVEPSITRHVIVPEYVFPDPSAGLMRDHSPVGSPPTNSAATVSRRGGRVPYTYDPATYAPDAGGVGAVEGEGPGVDGAGSEGEGTGDRVGGTLDAWATTDGGGVASV